MELGFLIKNDLEKKYGVRFNVKKENNPSLIKYRVNLGNSDKEYFKVEAEIKNDTRLTIVAEPEKYGANYLELMNSSPIEKRILFNSYWEQIEKEKIKITVRINEIPTTRDNFLKDDSIWQKFSIRITKSPYYEENEDKQDKVVSNITLIAGMMLSLIDYRVEGFEEGNVIEKTVKSYERNPLNRELCLHVKGYTCACCGFNFKEKYGKIGENFIEVHHVIPVSEMGDNYIVDPVNDLVPLCSNCHSMIHRKNPPYTVEELKKIIEEQDDLN